MLALYTISTVRRSSKYTPQVINALSDQLVDSVSVVPTDQIPHQLQFRLQLFDTCVPNSWRDPVLQDFLCGVLNVIQVPSELAHGIVPQLEARVTLDAVGEGAGVAAGAFVATQPRRSLPALTCPRYPVALGYL